MQFTATIPESIAEQLYRAAFDGNVRVYEGYSRPEKDLREFYDLDALTMHIQSDRTSGVRSFDFALYYPEAKGQVEVRTIKLDPTKCNGATWRKVIEGWGVIHLHLRFGKDETVELHITVNSEKRANAWAHTYQRMGAPNLWDWIVVQKQAGRLIRLLRRIAKT
jgi:hypothetical protein